MSVTNKRNYRSRISSNKEKTKIASHAHDLIEPPDWMGGEATTFFDNVIGRKANVDWNEHDINVAAQLATKEYQYSIVNKRISDSLYSDVGELKTLTQIGNGLGNQIIQYRRTLNIHQTSYGSSAQRAGQRANQAAEMEKKIKLISDKGKFLD